MNFIEIDNIIYDCFEEEVIKNRPYDNTGDYFILGGWCKNDMEKQNKQNRYILDKYGKDFNHVDLILELHEKFNYNISNLIENGNPEYTFRENLILESIKSILNEFEDVIITDDEIWCEVCKSDKNSKTWVGCERCDSDYFFGDEKK